MDLNVTAVFNGCKAVEPIMRAAGDGADAARKEEGRMILLQLFWSFLQIGLFSFGGGYAAMPLIQAKTPLAASCSSAPAACAAFSARARTA